MEVSTCPGSMVGPPWYPGAHQSIPNFPGNDQIHENYISSPFPRNSRARAPPVEIAPFSGTPRSSSVHSSKQSSSLSSRGISSGAVFREASLNEELAELVEKEKYVDQLCTWAKQNIRYTMQEKDARTLAYVTRDDLLQCFFKHSVLTVKGHDKVERLPVMVDNTIIMGRGLRVSSKGKPMEVLMATDEGKSLIQTNPSDDWKGDALASTGSGAGGGKRKTKLVATRTDVPYVNPMAVPDHFEVDRDTDDKKGVLQRYQEYKKTANMLLNVRSKNPIQDRRLRLRNYYQGRREGFCFSRIQLL